MELYNFYYTLVTLTTDINYISCMQSQLYNILIDESRNFIMY